MAQSTNKKKIIVYALIAFGFAGLIGGHELATMAPASADDPRAAVPFILAALGTLSFVAAGLMARKLMKQGAPQ